LKVDGVEIGIAVDTAKNRPPPPNQRLHSCVAGVKRLAWGLLAWCIMVMMYYRPDNVTKRQGR